MKYVNETSIENVENIIEELGLSMTSYVLVLILNLVIVGVGLVGNIFVLYSSLKHKAIKVDKISLLLLEALTMSDIAIITLYFSPMLITLCGKKWVLGLGICFVTGLLSEVPFYFQIMVKTIISCYRLRVCMSNRSLRGAGIGKIFLVKMGILALFVPSLAPAIVFLAHKSNSVFIPQILRCMSAHYSKAHGNSKAYKHITMLTATFIAIPTVIILVTNISIWITVKKSHNRSRRGSNSSTKNNQGRDRRMNKTALMLTLICCTFVLCYIPTFIKFVLYNMGYEISLFMYLFHSYALSLNSIVNPFIYLITNEHFRSFMKEFFQNIANEITSNSSDEIVHSTPAK